MIRFLIIAIFFTLVFISNATYGQAGYDKPHTYDIESLEGRKEKIVVIDDGGHEWLLIIHAKDTLCVIDNKYGIQNIQFLNKNFLGIYYGQPGGNGLQSSELLLLCISNGKLYPALHIMASDYFVIGDRYGEEEHDTFDVKIKPEGSIGNGDLRLLTTVRKISKIQDHPENSYNYHQTTVLYFDKQHRIFYNMHKYVNKTYNIHDLWDFYLYPGPVKGKAGMPVPTGIAKPHKVRFKGTYPVVYIGPKKYGYDERYCIDGSWYELYDSSYDPGHMPVAEKDAIVWLPGKRQ